MQKVHDLYLKNGSNEMLMSIKSSYVNFCLLQKATFALSDTVTDIITVEMCMTLTLKWAKVKCKYASQKPIYETIYILANCQCLPYLSPFAK